MGETTSRLKQKRTYTFVSNFKYLIFSLKNEKFPIHPKTVKVKCPRKIYYLWMPREEEVKTLWTSFMDGPNTVKGWNELLDYLPKTKKFGCVGRGDLTSLFFSKVVKY